MLFMRVACASAWLFVACCLMVVVVVCWFVVVCCSSLSLFVVRCLSVNARCCSSVLVVFLLFDVCWHLLFGVRVCLLLFTVRCLFCVAVC